MKVFARILPDKKHILLTVLNNSFKIIIVGCLVYQEFMEKEEIK